MAIDTSEIRIGANGSVHVAPVGSTLPTDIETALDAAFVDLGAINEDGVELSPSRSVEKIRAWQSGKPVRVVITEDELTVSFALQQWNETTIPLAFGGGSIATTAGPPAYYTYTPPAAGTVDERAFVVAWQDGDHDYRLVIPKGMVTEVDGIQLVKANAAELVLSVEVMKPASGDEFYIVTDDPAFAA